MPGINLRGDVEVKRALRELRKLVDTDKDRVLRMVGMEGVIGVRRNIRNQRGPNGEVWPPTHRGGQMLRKTSRLYNSITFLAPSGASSVWIGTNVIYAALLHYGGTVRAKRGKMMAMPLSPAVARKYSGSFKRDYPNAFVLTSAKGNVLLVQKKVSRGGGLEFLALLRESFTYKRRPYLGLDVETWTRIRQRGEGMARAIWEARAASA